MYYFVTWPCTDVYALSVYKVVHFLLPFPDTGDCSPELSLVEFFQSLNQQILWPQLYLSPSNNSLLFCLLLIELLFWARTSISNCCPWHLVLAPLHTFLSKYNPFITWHILTSQFSSFSSFKRPNRRNPLFRRYIYSWDTYSLHAPALSRHHHTDGRGHTNSAVSYWLLIVFKALYTNKAVVSRWSHKLPHGKTSDSIHSEHYSDVPFSVAFEQLTKSRKFTHSFAVK